LRAPIRFFDSTPVGRIVNRFSNDISTVDSNLMESFLGFAFCLTKVFSVLIFSIILLPVLAFAVIPMTYLYYLMQRKYRVAAREAKRFDSISRAPRYNFFKETLDGLAVIRAMDGQEIFLAEFERRLDAWQKAFHAVIFFNRWFSSRVPLLNAGIALTTAIGVTLLSHQGAMLAGTAGLVLSFALNSAGVLNWAIRSFSSLETQMTSVERVRHFIALKPEPDITVPSTLAEGEMWPQHTDVEFKNVHVRYAPHLPLVLKDLSFRVPAGSKAALVGRTGSGKTTIFQALFRFVDVEKGEILIGGKNIAGIPLNTLRRTIAVIPQDPVLFVGNLRRNLDFFHQHSDEHLWEVLERVHLADFVRTLPGGLDATVLESGSTLSQGQRQLVCLARALLEKSRIIIVDEATANVDVQTDALVQRAIRHETEGITVIIIAHRMGTVADCEPIITLNAPS
jgi:ABC-type multidrug transport system fused ATPase/permease subunit